MGSSLAASCNWWVISTARERPSAADLRSGEVQHRVGIREQSGVTEIISLSSLFLPIHDHLRFALDGLSSLSHTDLQW